MLAGVDLLDATDWSRLHHAYGRATDTPGHLRALLGSDDAARRAAVDHLWGAVLHQGTPFTATAPTALVLTVLLTDRRLESVAVRASLMRFLAQVALVQENSGLPVEELVLLASHDIEAQLAAGDDDALFEDVDALDTLYARAILACTQVVPQIGAAALAGLADSDEGVRKASATAWAAVKKAAP